jgi:chromosome segregation ATPase
MTETADERDQLIADLLEEAHGLRMKLEDFSQYTESKVAEFVIARKAFEEERSASQQHLVLAQHDIEVFRNRQDQMQKQMIEMNAKVRAMEQRVERLIKQRDAARERVRALESSRAVRIAARLRKLLRRG